MSARYRRTRRSPNSSKTGDSRSVTNSRNSVPESENSKNVSVSPKLLKAQRTIVNLLQRLVLERPNMVCVVEDLMEGMLQSRRAGDRNRPDDETPEGSEPDE